MEHRGHEDFERDYQRQVERYLPEEIRHGIEQKYYAQVRDQALFAQFTTNPEFLADPKEHLALYSDHGIVHVQDVARQILHVLETVHGRLIPRRSRVRLDF